MSYCRWSSGDFSSDLYIYADCYGGYTTHIAGNRLIPKEPLPPPVWVPGKKLPKSKYSAWRKRELEVRRILNEARRVKIKLPHVGETFNDPTLEDLIQRLIYLGRLGYQFPDTLVGTLIEEIKDDEMTATVKGIMRTRAGKYKTAEYKQGWTHGRDAAITATMKRRGR